MEVEDTESLSDKGHPTQSGCGRKEYHGAHPGAWTRHNNDTDIVQLGLMEEQESHVYLAAQRMADMRPETLYLEWRNRSSISSHNIATMDHPGSEARVVKFLMDERLVTGGADGNIYVWNVGSGEVLQKLNCHSSEVARGRSQHFWGETEH